MSSNPGAPSPPAPGKIHGNYEPIAMSAWSAQTTGGRT